MTARDKLIEIIDSVQSYGVSTFGEHKDTYSGMIVKNNELVDALIASGLFCDINKVGKLLGKMFGEDCPCNYCFGDEDVSDVFAEYDPEWCVEYCDDAEYDQCWVKFAEAKLKE